MATERTPASSFEWEVLPQFGGAAVTVYLQTVTAVPVCWWIRVVLVNDSRASHCAPGLLCVVTFDVGHRSNSLYQRSTSRSRYASTTFSNSALRSIIAQWPQLWKTCSSQFGIRRIGMRELSRGVTRSSRPKVTRVGA